MLTFNQVGRIDAPQALTAPDLLVTSQSVQKPPPAKESKSSAPPSVLDTSELHQYIPRELMKKLQAARGKGRMVGERRVELIALSIERTFVPFARETECEK